MADQRWNAVVQLAEGILNRFASGRPGIGWERKAAVEVVKLSRNVAAREVVENVLAMYLMLDMEPRRFVTDRAFRTQLVRRVRGLTRINAREWVDQDSGRLKRVYTELPPRVTRSIGEWLASALGGIGVYLANLEREEVRGRDREARELTEALEGVR
ncbi:hypothetical protein [Methylocystis echinoides]|uniref:hypothetical protein n=1 Tax=Methylocystis echinoides TaxID=29468 RepID=UPI00344730CD